jgi:magnesium chelatase family protein
MTLARSRGVVVTGVEGLVVEIEAYLAQGLPGMNIVGLGDTAVGESRDRVRAAIHNSELPWPSERRITVGLSPASIHKKGASLDLAIALAILAAQGTVPEDSQVVAVGELALDGRVNPVKGVLVAAIAARKSGCGILLVPHTQVAEAQLVPDLKVVGVSCLKDAMAFLHEEPFEVDGLAPVPPNVDPIPDLSDVRGQSVARQALEVAAAGGHHLAFLGSPGVGKTMLAERLPGLLPELDDDLALDVTAIYSSAGKLREGSGLMRTAPFQAPHHTATTAAMIGGGSNVVRIGMVTLAHGGVLCLDEAAEFDRVVLDALRQPLESGVVTVSRAGFSSLMPARFQLVLASNPCPCGKFVGTGAQCSCSPQVRRRYMSRISGPLLDRIDLRVTLERPTMADLDPDGLEPESTAPVAQRVKEARARAAHRYQGTPWLLNAHVPGPILRRRYHVEPAAQALLMRDVVGLSARGIDRVLRIAWTIADLNAHDRPTVADVAGALTFRDGNGSWMAA